MAVAVAVDSPKPNGLPKRKRKGPVRTELDLTQEIKAVLVPMENRKANKLLARLIRLLPALVKNDTGNSPLHVIIFFFFLSFFFCWKKKIKKI
jgi:hypothetical protein